MRRKIKRGGFTLLELMVVVIIIGVLASIAWPRYIFITEKSRTSEAKSILGQIRSAEIGYFTENDAYTTNLTKLSVDVPMACNASFYYSYSIAGGGVSFTATATRCTAGGRSPNSPGGTAYVININENGVLGGTQPYV